MKCEEARAMIEQGLEAEGLAAHLEGCAGCHEERALWGLLGEAGGIEPPPGFPGRVLAKIRAGAKRHHRPWERLRGLLGPGRGARGNLEEFADFPPGSFGEVLLGETSCGAQGGSRS